MWPRALPSRVSITATALIPASATKSLFWSGESARPKGMIPRRFLSLSSRVSRIVWITASFSVSMTEMVSLLPLLTKTRSSVAATEFGLDPPTAGIPSTISPTSTPVLILAVTRGSAGSETSSSQTEKDSGTFGSPRPGTRYPSFSTPSLASLDPKAKGG